LFIGIAYFRQYQLVEAARAFQQAVKLRPTDKEAWHWLGKAEMRLGHYDEAIRALEKAQALAPKDVNVLYLLG
jgi:Flp pilus assembly protein TadD